jgi:hypothetical protein
MSMLRLIPRRGVAVVLATAVIACGTGAADASAPRTGGTIHVKQPAGGPARLKFSARVYVVRGRISCSRARAVVKTGEKVARFEETVHAGGWRYTWLARAPLVLTCRRDGTVVRGVEVISMST